MVLSDGRQDMVMKRNFIALLIGSSLILSCWMTPAPAAELNPLLAPSVKYQNIKVTRVLAVDRILLENDEKIALIGIKGPKPPKFADVKRDAHGFIVPDDVPEVPFEVEALRFAKDLVEGKTVRLEFDTERRNDQGIVEAYVYLPDGKLLNAELLRFGYADIKLIPPNMKYAQDLRKAYQEARHEMRGLQGGW